MAEEIDFDEFKKVEMRAGVVVEAEPFPEARKPAYKLLIDFGELGIRRSSAQITSLYSPDDLRGKQVIAVTNLKPKRIAGFISEVLVLGVSDSEGRTVLLTTERQAQIGGIVH